MNLLNLEPARSFIYIYNHYILPAIASAGSVCPRPVSGYFMHSVSFREIPMKIIFNLILLSALIGSVSANADCLNNQNGNVVCGGGQCEIDQYGKVYCAAPGGGAMKDQYGNVMCGVGYCAKDDSSRVWCSKKPGGGAATDSHGQVKCFGGCDPGTASQCQEARH